MYETQANFLAPACNCFLKLAPHIPEPIGSSRPYTVLGDGNHLLGFSIPNIGKNEVNHPGIPKRADPISSGEFQRVRTPRARKDGLAGVLAQC